VSVVPATAQPEARTVEFKVGDGTRYRPAEIEARAGEQLRVVMTYTGQMAKSSVAHNFILLKKGTNARDFAEKFATIEEPDFAAAGVQDRVIASTNLVGADETAKVTFDVPPERGEYPFVCTFKGHYRLGMRGQLVVK
jgi:azurin